MLILHIYSSGGPRYSAHGVVGLCVRTARVIPPDHQVSAASQIERGISNRIQLNSDVESTDLRRLCLHRCWHRNARRIIGTRSTHAFFTDDSGSTLRTRGQIASRLKNIRATVTIYRLCF